MDSRHVYGGKSYGMIYFCDNGHQAAWVGCHKGTDKPLGSLATASLREDRKRAHAVFDRLWQSGRMSRSNAYKWLSEQMKLSLDMTHIGMFTEAQCRTVRELSVRKLMGMKDSVHRLRA
jgi:hypothetical protein